jgi:sugar phosphate isomerase/epimerase
MKKNYLFTLLCALTSIFLSFGFKAEYKVAQKLFPKKLGMVSYTYRKSFEKNVPATLDTIKSLGITDIEFSNLFGKTAQELRNLLDERGMKCSSFGVSYTDLENKIGEVAKNAKTLGAEYVRVAWIPHTKGEFTLEVAKKTVGDFNKFGEILKKEGLTFCYHNHGYEFYKYEDGTLFDYIIKNTKPEYVSFEMDILWTFFPGADPIALLAKYGNRFKLMHLKDLKKGVVGNLSGGTSPENSVALGTGQLDIPGILKAAKKAKIKHYYIEDESSNIATQVPQTIAYLNSLRL